MSPAARRSLLAALAVLAVVGLLEQARQTSRFKSEIEPTSFGTTGTGYQALFDLLTELEVPVSRNYLPPADLPAGKTVWWIDATGLCAESAELVPGDDSERLRAWIEAGGTALVFFTGQGLPCAYIAGVAVPGAAHVHEDAVGMPHPQQPEPSRPHGGDHDRNESLMPQSITGSIVSRPRVIANTALATFAAANDWRVAGLIDERPYVIERDIGAGRLVLVADAAFLSNGLLDQGDAATLAVDLVRAYGAPVLDEHEHGLRMNGSALAYLVRSPAWPLFAGLIVLALVVSWRGSGVPALTARAPEAAAPTLEAFVDSLATLYARTRDYPRVASRYRELTAERLRRQLGLPLETPITVLAERLRLDSRTSPTALKTLLEDRPLGSEAELRGAVRLLDSLAPNARGGTGFSPRFRPRSSVAAGSRSYPGFSTGHETSRDTILP